MDLKSEMWSSSSSRDRLLLFLSTTLLLFIFLPSATSSATYDCKAIIVNGQRRILISDSIHYPRSVPEMWPGLIQKAKDGGLDVIQTYVFWNGHEPSPGKRVPIWLKYVPGISFRTNNGPFKAAMAGFIKKIVNMMKAEGLFEWQGGPIILSQIENEYGPMKYELGAPAWAYSQWAADMAVGLNTSVPWVMYKQDDAPDPVWFLL